MQSISATDPKKFYWMRYAQDRATNVTVKGETLKITKGTLFGVREVRGSTTDEILLRDGTRFRLEIKKSDILMNRSKPFNGKVKLDTPAKPAAKKPKSSSPVRVKKKSEPEIKIKVGPKPTVSKLVPTLNGKGPVKVRLSDVNMPDEDDFTDNELPAEFQRFAHISSNGKTEYDYFGAFASSHNLADDYGHDTVSAFNQIIRTQVEPYIKRAQEEIDSAIKSASAKLKAWAIVHLTQAKQLGRDPTLFEKIVNNPSAVVKQLAHNMLGMRPSNMPKTETHIDNILDGLKF